MTQRQVVPAAETKPPGPPERTQVGSRALSRGFKASQKCYSRAGALCPAELSLMGTEQVTVLRSTARGHRPWFIAQGGDGALTLPPPRTTRALNALVSLPRKVCSLLGRPELLKHPLRALLPSRKTPRRGINSPVVRHRGQVEALWGEADRPQGAGVDIAAVIQRRVQGDMAAGGEHAQPEP